MIGIFTVIIMGFGGSMLIDAFTDEGDISRKLMKGGLIIIIVFAVIFSIVAPDEDDEYEVKDVTKEASWFEKLYTPPKEETTFDTDGCITDLLNKGYMNSSAIQLCNIMEDD